MLHACLLHLSAWNSMCEILPQIQKQLCAPLSRPSRTYCLGHTEVAPCSLPCVPPTVLSGTMEAQPPSSPGLLFHGSLTCFRLLQPTLMECFGLCVQLIPVLLLSLCYTLPVASVGMWHQVL